MKRKTSNTDLRAISKDEQEIVRGYVLFRPLYRPNITIAKTIPFIGQKTLEQWSIFVHRRRNCFLERMDDWNHWWFNYPTRFSTGYFNKTY